MQDLIFEWLLEVEGYFFYVSYKVVYIETVFFDIEGLLFLRVPFKVSSIEVVVCGLSNSVTLLLFLYYFG